MAIGRGTSLQEVGEFTFMGIFWYVIIGFAVMYALSFVIDSLRQPLNTALFIIILGVVLFSVLRIVSDKQVTGKEIGVILLVIGIIIALYIIFPWIMPDSYLNAITPIKTGVQSILSP